MRTYREDFLAKNVSNLVDIFLNFSSSQFQLHVTLNIYTNKAFFYVILFSVLTQWMAKEKRKYLLEIIFHE